MLVICVASWRVKIIGALVQWASSLFDPSGSDFTQIELELELNATCEISRLEADFLCFEFLWNVTV